MENLFLNNKYSKWYFSIITRAQSRGVLPVKGEKHHVIPECFYLNRKRKGTSGWLPGDPDCVTNIVLLTSREHFVCHLLLPKMTTGPARYKSLRAILGMSTLTGKGQDRKKLTGRLYALMAKNLSEADIPESVRKNYKDAAIKREAKYREMGRENSFKGKKHSEKTILKMREKASRPKSLAWKESASKNRQGNIPHNKGKTFEDLYGEVRAAEIKTKIARLGEQNGFYGKTHSVEQRKRKSAEKLAAPKLVCYHCERELDAMNYYRWHGDNCKHRKK